MIDLDSMFRYKVPDRDALLANGFLYGGGAYKKSIPILQEQFTVRISVTDEGAVRFQVFEAESGEEYVLVHVPGAEGGFIGEVRGACERALNDLSNRCFHTEPLKAEQTKRVVEWIWEQYGVKPEFLWDAYPDCAAFRLPENGKWFAVILTVDRAKVGLSGHGTIEIIDLKDTPEHVAQRVDESRFLKAYHMNKKHWYAICLDGRVPDEEIGALIHISHELAGGRHKK